METLLVYPYYVISKIRYPDIFLAFELFFDKYVGPYIFEPIVILFVLVLVIIVNVFLLLVAPLLIFTIVEIVLYHVALQYGVPNQGLINVIAFVPSVILFLLTIPIAWEVTKNDLFNVDFWKKFGTALLSITVHGSVYVAVKYFLPLVLKALTINT